MSFIFVLLPIFLPSFFLCCILREIYAFFSLLMENFSIKKSRRTNTLTEISLTNTFKENFQSGFFFPQQINWMGGIEWDEVKIIPRARTDQRVRI